MQGSIPQAAHKVPDAGQEPAFDIDIGFVAPVTEPHEQIRAAEIAEARSSPVPDASGVRSSFSSEANSEPSETSSLDGSAFSISKSVEVGALADKGDAPDDPAASVEASPTSRAKP
jgi:hypothetical protein